MGCAIRFLNVTVERIKAAIDYDAISIRPRLRYDPAQETVQAIQGHSADCGLSAEQLLSDGCDELAGLAAALRITAPLSAPCKG